LQEQSRLQPLSNSQREALAQAASEYQEGLTVDAVSWLVGRGLTRETVVGARLGVVTDPHPGHGRFKGMLAIPYLGPDDVVLNLRFRCIEELCDHHGHGKYNDVPGGQTRLYGVDSIHRAVAAFSDDIHITEGEIDRLVLEQCGLHAVGVSGATKWLPRWRRMLAGFSRAFVWGDPDDAGAKFTNTVCQSMRQARGVRLREGDVNETYLQHGAEHLLGLIEKEKK
jgi:hypothetical protein